MRGVRSGATGADMSLTRSPPLLTLLLLPVRCSVRKTEPILPAAHSVASEHAFHHTSTRGRRRVIRVEHLTKNYGPRVAVADITFDVVKGEVLGFLGPNGAGKTTT